MNKYLNFIIITLIVILLGSCSQPTNNRETFVRSFLERYPKATLQDIYKGSFQDVFGPAHLLTDRKAVENYIRSEMFNTTTWENEDYIPCGWQGNFYQVNLKVIADGRVPMDVFVDAFMASANGIDTTLTQAWVEEWQQIQATVRKVAPSLEGFAIDSTLLANLLKEGKYVVHHSASFNKHYHPHYRIIRKDLFEEKILPRLK